VADGASLVGTPLLDHVVVARRRASSMLELGLLSASARRERLLP